MFVLSWAVPLDEMVEWFYKNKTYGGSLRSCALVGGSVVARGSSRGNDIDAHDTVIRVNRMPTSKYAADFGRRTDILFANLETANTARTFEMGGAKTYCKTTKATAVVFKGTCNPKRLWAPVARKWRSCGLPVGHQKDDIARGVCGLTLYKNSGGSRQVTSGFLAFVTFAPVCETLTLYAFGGPPEAADGHKQLHHHDTPAENDLVDAIIETNELRDDDANHDRNFRRLQSYLANLKPKVRVVRD
ncbi:hypothetical protein CTAYLR_005657 [Chrysophaeum taylorii]|uniref:Uncharacterized protein n=1 Tax=Chrysophaeum taylorii TaxID=2483200 RepID=A0AAD7UMV9_9STRA|nr:hypothetical protein CTAYLR_005657 [Chrysophaeum taylorii]